MLITLLSILFVISAILLIGIVLLQDEQGDGMGGIFGGGSGTAFGSRSGNILTRITSILAVVFLGSAFIIGFINSTSVNDKQEQLAKTRELLDENREDWLYNEEKQDSADQTVQTEETGAELEPQAENSDQ
jgi:preprotein translocase subunit SecG